MDSALKQIVLAELIIAVSLLWLFTKLICCYVTDIDEFHQIFLIYKIHMMIKKKVPLQTIWKVPFGCQNTPVEI